MKFTDCIHQHDVWMYVPQELVVTLGQGVITRTKYSPASWANIYGVANEESLSNFAVLAEAVAEANTSVYHIWAS